ncbi:Clusterin-associated protein 1 [Gaertneriomyces sp. JEL0708]|nr:Clusterin-associated protein 1 [Gaertneriomyces sp. JEL0708]
MRSLGYPNLISLESFRYPNFDLVADTLLWLVKSYDPSIDVPEDVDTEQDRIMFIKSIASFMAPKAHIKLNTRKLYMADGNAVKELLKIANVLYEAKNQKDTDKDDTGRIAPLDISSRIGQLRTCRQLGSEITETGAWLYDLLAKEMQLRDVRTAVISRPFELNTMQVAVNEAITNLRGQLSVTQAALDNLGADEGNLLSKIDKKKSELERAQKRLQSLQSVRPAYMDEFERIQKDLVVLYEQYMDRFRNQAYLEQQLDEHNRQEQDRFEETEGTLKKMQTRLREEELRLLRGDKEMRDVLGDAYTSDRPISRMSRPKAAGANQRSRSFVNESESDSEDGLGDDQGDEISLSESELINNNDILIDDDDEDGEDDSQMDLDDDEDANDGESDYAPGRMGSRRMADDVSYESDDNDF